MAKIENIPVSKEHQDMLRILCKHDLPGRIQPAYKISEQAPVLDFAIVDQKIGFVMKNRNVDAAFFSGWLLLRIL